MLALVECEIVGCESCSSGGVNLLDLIRVNRTCRAAWNDDSGIGAIDYFYGSVHPAVKSAGYREWRIEGDRPQFLDNCRARSARH